jgi:hypothetical protein
LRTSHEAAPGLQSLHEVVLGLHGRLHALLHALHDHLLVVPLV